MEGDGEIRLRDGRNVMLRVATPADVPRIAELYAGLSPASFRLRFFSGCPKPALLARLARIDMAPGVVSLIALAPGSDRLAAEARYVPTAEDAGELALAVLDDFQGLGLGRLMLSALIDHAKAAGLERLSAVVNINNDTMLHLLTRYGSALTEPADESFVIGLEISATGGMPGWPRTAGRRILVERRGWFDDRHVAALRAEGNDVRQCTGPDGGRTCALVEDGRLPAGRGSRPHRDPAPDDDAQLCRGHRGTPAPVARQACAVS